MFQDRTAQKIENIKEPEKMGSYVQDDCIFLLKNINGLVNEQENKERETAMQSGTHYSAMLPVEYTPKKEYTELFFRTLSETAENVAMHTATVAEKIFAEKGRDTVLVSLARAGTPFGVLIKRYIKEKYHVDMPHYSISIIRDIGIDENAMLYIINQHGNHIQFIDGWTGKGVIAKTLMKACNEFYEKYQIELDCNLAVLSDPGYCATIFGTREDYLVPNACLNSTVSGLMSRTFYREDIIGPNDFHGAKYYTEFAASDVSLRFVDTISSYFKCVRPNMKIVNGKFDVPFSGEKQIAQIMHDFEITDGNKVKPGVGETTRVLLRHVPWKILIRAGTEKNLKHILLLAKEREVPLVVYNDMNYSCCGLIKNMLKGE
jgi:hypothetical protein